MDLLYKLLLWTFCTLAVAINSQYLDISRDCWIITSLRFMLHFVVVLLQICCGVVQQIHNKLKKLGLRLRQDIYIAPRSE